MKSKKLIMLMISALLFGSVNCTKNVNQSTLSNCPKVKLAQDEEDSVDDDYEYDGFFNLIIPTADLVQDDSFVTLKGHTSSDYLGIEFDTTFDFNTMTFTFLSKYSNFERVITPAIISSDGSLSAVVHDDYNNLDYDINEYKELSKLENFISSNSISEQETCSLIDVFIPPIFKILVTVYVVVAEVSKQVQAENNLKENKKLESNDDGVKLGNYIYDQCESDVDGRKSAAYCFGFAHFSDVGCEVASVYNLLIKLRKEEMLSQVIYDFEKMAIEFSVAWGHFGSNPREIYRYLKKKEISYKKNTWYYFYEKKFNNASIGANLIMSRWNDDASTGIHTYYMEKVTTTQVEIYNFDPNITTIRPVEIAFDDVPDCTGKFVVGYVIL